MKPIAVFRHIALEGPGHFAEFLNERNIPWELIAIDAGDAVPQNVAEFAGLVFMGGPMSVNDGLPWIAQAEEVVRTAVAKDIPLLGHCLGGQLIAKALGGVVRRNSVKEIGWGEVTVSDNVIAHDWFGDIKSFQAFHWHGETFTLPQGATNLLSSIHCTHQAFAIGKHLAMQCHVEMTSEMVITWCEAGADEIEASRASPAVQPINKILSCTAANLQIMKDVADYLYAKWVFGLAH